QADGKRAHVKLFRSLVVVEERREIVVGDQPDVSDSNFEERTVAKLPEIVVLLVLDGPDFAVLAVLELGTGIIDRSVPAADGGPKAPAGVIGTGTEPNLDRYIDVVGNQHGLLDAWVQVRRGYQSRFGYGARKGIIVDEFEAFKAESQPGMYAELCIADPLIELVKDVDGPGAPEPDVERIRRVERPVEAELQHEGSGQVRKAPAVGLWSCCGILCDSAETQCHC